MQAFFKKFIIFCGIIAAISFVTNFTILTPVSAASRSDFFGLDTWDKGIPNPINSQDDLIKAIVIIATNVLNDISVIAAYLVLGFVIYGGFLYMFSSGDPNRAAAGKKTITRAFIGLGISIGAYVIFNAIRIAIVGASGNFGSCNIAYNNEICVTGADMITNAIQWIFGIAGVACAIFVILSGVSYMTSSGDPNKLQKAKSTLMYALIGLAIVALAEIITGFVSKIIKDNTSPTPTSSIIINHNQEIT